MFQASSRSIVLALLAGIWTGCSEPPAPHVSADDVLPSETPLRAESLEPTIDQDVRGLLDLAFDAASKMPTNPHAKNRARGQAEIVDLCFRIGQPDLALAYAENIDNWRRGLAEAMYAASLVERGDKDGVTELLERALASSESAEGWRKHRIRGQVAAVLVQLGDTQGAASVALDLTPSEMGAYQRSRATGIAAGDVEALLDGIEPQISTGDFEMHRHALQTMVLLIREHPELDDLRARMESRILESWERMPVQLRIELAAELAEVSLEREDRTRATFWVDQADTLLGGSSWIPEHRIPLVCSVALLRAQLGDRGHAEADLKLMEQLYDEQRETIVNIYRADALAPLAAAWHALGNSGRATQYATLAVEASLENPNSRPRVDDLILICCTLVEAGMAPDPQLHGRLKAVAEGLGSPW